MMPSPCGRDRAARPGGKDAASLSADLLHLMMRLMRSVAREMRRSPQALAPGQMAALMKLSIAPSSTSALAQHLGVSVPTVSKSIDVLTGRGWVERGADPADRRQTILRLTPKGRRVTAAIRRQSQQHLARLLAPLTAAQRAEVRTALDALAIVLPA